MSLLDKELLMMLYGRNFLTVIKAIRVKDRNEGRLAEKIPLGREKDWRLILKCIKILLMMFRFVSL
jgi:hypothetical protein